MRTTFLTTAILVTALALGGTAGHADPITNPATGAWEAPIGHLQPRAQAVSPGAPVEQQMSADDAEQQKLDEQLDKRLNICRGC
jgi:hypothetical protein